MAKHDLEKERNEGGDDTELKVTDRRLFTADGQLRGGIEDESDAEETDAESGESPGNDTGTSARPARPEAQPPRAGAGFERRPVDEPEGVDFTMLISAMAQPALIYLGEIAHPGTGKPEVNIEQARLQIDLLDLLRVKCRGNLTNEEEGHLDELLYRLRMACVARSQQMPGKPPG